MADFTRSSLYPEGRVRGQQITCPRCRVDPSHISRQYWEATRSQSTAVDVVVGQSPAVVPNAPVELRMNGYPDLCPRSSSSSFRSHSAAAAQQARTTSTSFYSQAHQRPTDTHSTRSGETWRIRGVFDNHSPDVVHRRSESNPGPLPDVTRHSNTPTSYQHSRMLSSSGYEHHVPRSAPSHNRYPDSRSRSFTASSGSSREHHHHHQQQSSFPRSDIVSNERRSAAPQPHWKREQQCSTTQSSSSSSNNNNNNNNPWVTRSQQQSDNNRPQPYSSNSVNNSSSNTNNATTHSSSSNCWRSSVLSAPQPVLSQCPLPDLVTPRRQARKQCCGLLATHSVAVRWLVVVVASLGLLCSIVGTVVGVVRAAGKEHLSIALLLIGLGIVLVSMSAIAWRLTSRDAPSCRAMFGFRRARSEPHRRFVPRVPHYGRPHPFSAMLYPDIPLRPPPPSYQASMQEYRLRLLLMDRPPPPPPPPTQMMATPPPPQHPPPPPPTYRGPATVYPRFPVSIGPSDYSRPPSYRSRPPSSVGQPSPMGPEDIDPPRNNTDDQQQQQHNNAAGCGSSSLRDSSQQTSSSSTSAAPNQNSSQLQRPAPSVVNHVEVVAQV